MQDRTGAYTTTFDASHLNPAGGCPAIREQEKAAVKSSTCTVKVPSFQQMKVLPR